MSIFKGIESDDKTKPPIPEEEDVDSVGGLVLKVLGHLPLESETFVYNGVSMKVEKLRLTI